MLGLSAEELARRAGISHRTLQRFEAQEGIPENRLGNLDAIEQALLELGISFIGDPVNDPGVQLNQRSAKPDFEA